jgi:galactitol-specific phosphotransferase system IIB component
LKEIAVEKGLSNISDYLKSNGYNVSEIDIEQKNNKDFIQRFDAVVLLDKDNDFMGIENTSIQAPIIVASGMKPEDIKTRIESVDKTARH